VAVVILGLIEVAFCFEWLNFYIDPGGRSDQVVMTIEGHLSPEKGILS
jgi:hypothetical protein